MEVAEAEKQATYKLGVEETQVRLTEELSVVCREHYDVSWGKALDAVGVLVDSDLRRLESIYYNPEIRELPSPDSSHFKQAPEASEQPLVDQAPLVLLEAPKESDQACGQGRKAEDLQEKVKDQGKKKTHSKSKDQALDAAASQPSQTIDPLALKMKTQILGPLLLFLFVCCFFF